MTFKDDENVEEDLNESKEALNQGLSDLDYLKSKGLKKETVSKQSNLQDEKQKKLFYTIKLEGLPYSTKKKDVKAFVGQNMGVKSIRVPRNIKGIAFVGFGTEEQR